MDTYCILYMLIQKTLIKKYILYIIQLKNVNSIFFFFYYPYAAFVVSQFCFFNLVIGRAMIFLHLVAVLQSQIMATFQWLAFLFSLFFVFSFFFFRLHLCNKEFIPITCFPLFSLIL